MYCPQCGATQLDELKFCKACGVNLVAVRKAVADPKAVEKFSWDKTWISEMLMSGEEAVRRSAELERLQGITPETKRLKEIKAGVITASVGVGVMITLFVIMQAIVLNPNIPPEVAVILRNVWVAGVIPMLVGASLIFNGTFISKKGITGIEAAPTATDTHRLEDPPQASFLPPKANTTPLERDAFSVTDETTRQLQEQALKVKRSSGN
jgi:voltage-gated potassium channel Kch